MRISHVKIRGYRSLSDVDVELDDYTALIGPNGCGKSSVLLALNWFFNGGDLEPEDCHRPAGQSGTDDTGSPSPTIQVSVTMTDLNAADREALGRYGRSDVATFRRTWRKGERDKIVGNAWQGPGFATVRNAGDAKAVDLAYKELQPKVPGLTPQTSKGRITAELDRWESDNADLTLLEEVDDADASHLFGINGANKIKERVQLVFVPAAVDMQSEMDGSSRGTALQTLVGTLMSTAAAQSRAEWAAKHADAITELNTAVTASIEKATGIQQSRVNERLSQMVPNASVEFRASMPEWAPRPDESISTHVAIDGVADHISRHGHGVQRSLLLAMLQALAPDSTLATQPADATDEDPDALTTDEQAVVENAMTDLPHLVVCIEEPEIYQHPIRARAFARVLGELADSSGAQVFLATHSPYFVAPRRFESLRLFSISERVTTAAGRSTIADVASRSGRDAAQVQKAIDLHLPGSFSEAFFGRGAVLVEGETDRVVIETLAERLGTPLDVLGCTIAAVGGKRNIPIAHAILSEVGVVSYPIVDGDALGAARKFGDAPTGDNVAKRDQVHASNRSATEKIIALLPSGGAASMGKAPHTFGAATTVSETHTVWNDDIETELDHWPSFVTALAAIGGTLRSKNLHAYREAAASADTEDVPDSLRACIESIVRSFA